MPSPTRTLQAVAVVLAAAGLSFTSAEAYAGKDRTQHRDAEHYQQEYQQVRHSDGYDQRQVRQHHSDRFNYNSRYVSHQNDAYHRRGDSRWNVAISVGNTRGYHHRGFHHGDFRHRGFHHGNVHHRGFHHNQHFGHINQQVVVSNHRGGYWNRVYIQPVYATRYYACGTPYRVCIRAGYWKRVWVSTGVGFGGAICH